MTTGFARPIWRPSKSAFVGYRPQDICRARGWDGNVIPVAPVKQGYLSLGGAVTVEGVRENADLFGLPQPTINIIGTPQPSDPGGANVECYLDFWGAWIWSVLTGQPADMTIAFADNDANGMPTAVSLLAQAGVEVPSCSWGMSEISQGRASVLQMQQAVQQAVALVKMWLESASGDNSADDGTNSLSVDCPSCIPEGLGIGGTNLVNKNGIWIDAAWGDGRPGDSGGGGGTSSIFGIPVYQQGVFTGTMRGVPDCAETADPNTGYMMISDGQQMCVGGTSGAAPTVAGFLAVVRGVMKLKGIPIPSTPHAMLYANRATIFKDVVLGSDGWPATVGYDRATGNGTFILPALIAAFTGQAVPPVIPVTPVTPVTPVNPPSVTSQQVLAAVNAYFAAAERQNPFIARRILMPVNQDVDTVIQQVFAQAQGQAAHWPGAGGILGGILGGVLGGLGGFGGGGFGGGTPVQGIDPTTGLPTTVIVPTQPPIWGGGGWGGRPGGFGGGGFGHPPGRRRILNAP